MKIEPILILMWRACLVPDRHIILNSLAPTSFDCRSIYKLQACLYNHWILNNWLCALSLTPTPYFLRLNSTSCTYTSGVSVDIMIIQILKLIMLWLQLCETE